MIIVPSHDEPYFRRAVTDQVLEGFTHFRSERMGVFEEESVKRYMEESEILRDLLHLMPITGQGMRMLLACPLAGLAFVKRKLEAMYRMVSDLHYAYELDEFACFLLNEIIEQLQPKRSDARLSLLFPEADREDQNGKLNQEVSDDDAFWHTTRGIDLIRIRQFFTEASRGLLPLETTESERRRWVELKTLDYTDFRRMGIDQKPDVLFGSTRPGIFREGIIQVIYETLRDDIPGMCPPEILYDVEGFRRKEKIAAGLPKLSV